VSEREELQWRIYEHLAAHTDVWNGPVLEKSLQRPREAKGFYRSISFGIKRYLDAEICIWGTNNIYVRAEGGLAYLIDGQYLDEDVLLSKLEEAEILLAPLPVNKPKELLIF
jgi:hypothetical protein